eukprot:scaffold90946_cov61-Phaeocystis_antarctica.AAC.7
MVASLLVPMQLIIQRLPVARDHCQVRLSARQLHDYRALQRREYCGHPPARNAQLPPYKDLSAPREGRSVTVAAAHQPHVLHHRAGLASGVRAVQPQQAGEPLCYHLAPVAQLTRVIAPPSEDVTCLAEGRAVPPATRDLAPLEHMACLEAHPVEAVRPSTGWRVTLRHRLLARLDAVMQHLDGSRAPHRVSMA